MATFYLQTRSAEGLAGPGAWSKTLSSDLSKPGSVTFTVPNSSTTSCLGITNRNVPSNADWEDGTITVKVRVTTASSAVLLGVQAVRFNSAGVAQQNTATAAEQTLSATGVYTFTLSSTTWTAGNCGDRLAIWYYFRSTNSHGGDVSITIETGTTDEAVAFTNLTRNTGTCYGVFARDLKQFRNDHVTSIAEGGQTEGDGVSNNIYLDSYVGAYEWMENTETFTAKIEAEPVGTAFDNTSNHSNTNPIQSNPEVPHIRRSQSCCFDSTRNRLLMSGGIDDTSTQYNDLWELSLDSIGSPTPQWKKLNPTGTPMSARRTHIMEYDATNDRVIIGYGFDGADKGDLFAISFSSSADGVWSTLSPTGTAPEARAQLSSAIDNANGKFYLVHGWGASRYNDIHELNLSTLAWTELNAGGGTAPSTRNDPAVVFDSTNNRLILFGGYDGTTRLSDTWEFDLSNNTYTQLSPTGTTPAGRELANAVYDPVHNRMILAGGRGGTAQSDFRTDVQQLDLTNGSEAWTNLTKADGRRNLAVWTNGSSVYDPNHDAMIIYGGMDESLYETRQTFIYDLSTDNEATPYGLHLNNGMKGRDAMAYAYNPDTRETLIMGGYRDPAIGDLFNGEHTSEIWLYSHANEYWYQPVRNSLFNMPPREGASACYDTVRDRFLIFGGMTGNNTTNNHHYNDIWELKKDANGVYQLREMSPTGTLPGARWLHAAVFDITNNRMIMFGGDINEVYSNDTWELDFSASEDGAWAQLSPTGTPPSARRQPTYIYDETNGRMIITHGATSSAAFVSDTFELDLSTNNGAWSSIGTGTAPTSRRGMAGVYAADKGYMFCTGGFNGTSVLNDTYYLNLSTNVWVTLSPGVQFLARRSHAAGYDETTETLMIYGGRDTANDGLSFDSRNNNYFFDTTNATESNWTWAFKVLYPYLQTSVKITGLTASTGYHWQAWGTGTNQGDSAKVSAFSNTEASIDFTTASGSVTTASVTKSLVYNTFQVESITKSLEYDVITSSSTSKSLGYEITLKQYSREDSLTLNSNDVVLSTVYSNSEENDVEVDDAVRINQVGTPPGYAIHQFKTVHTNNTDPFTVNWNGQSDLAPSSNAVILQIYNYTTTAWETLDTNNTASADTDFTLTGSKSTSLTDYYNAANAVTCRVYQQG